MRGHGQRRRTGDSRADMLAELAIAPATAQELADAAGISLKQAHKHLRHLVVLGLVRDTGLVTRPDDAPRGRPFRVFALAQEQNAGGGK